MSLDFNRDFLQNAVRNDEYFETVQIAGPTHSD